jgi:predicted RNA binding protein YcfA (HicA-like mRNA interferase family)
VSGQLPVISGAQLIRALERLGSETVRQRGSHVRLRHRERHTFLVVPLHRELKRGTLRGPRNPQRRRAFSPLRS